MNRECLGFQFQQTGFYFVNDEVQRTFNNEELFGAFSVDFSNSGNHWRTNHFEFKIDEQSI